MNYGDAEHQQHTQVCAVLDTLLSSDAFPLDIADATMTALANMPVSDRAVAHRELILRAHHCVRYHRRTS